MKINTKSMLFGVTILSASLLLSACGQTPASSGIPASTTATYLVTIHNATNDTAYMGATSATDRTGLNFSRFAVLTHKNTGAMWDSLHPATQGIVHVAEWGRVDADGVANGDISLDEMNRTLIAQGQGFSKAISGGPTTAGNTVTFNISVNSDYPYVSLAGMIAPSADFFTGVYDVQLVVDGQFVSTKELNLLGYSAESRTQDVVDLKVLRSASENASVERPTWNIALIGSSTQVPSRIKNTILPTTIFGTVTFTKQ